MTEVSLPLAGRHPGADVGLDLVLPANAPRRSAPPAAARAAEAGPDALDGGTAVLDAARAGDQTAFAHLYRDTQPRLRRYAIGLVGQDADDVTAEAWLQIARDLRSFTGDEQAFRGWAATIVRHRALDLIRAAKRRPADPVPTHELDHVGTHDTEATAFESIGTAAAVRLIATLPQDQAEAVLLRAVVGLDAGTAGEVLGKSAGAVRVSAHRGLKALARQLDERPPDSSPRRR